MTKTFKCSPFNYFYFLLVIFVGLGHAQSVDSLATALSKARSAPDSIQILNELSATILGEEPEQALANSQTALSIAKRINDMRGMGISLIRLGQYNHRSGLHKTATDYFDEAIQLLDEDRYPQVLAEAYTMKGRVQADGAQTRPQAIAATKQALIIYKKLGENFQVGSLTNSIGYRYWRLADYDSALVYFNQAMEIRKDLPQRDKLAQTMNNLGVVYYNTGAYKQSLEYYFDALEIQQQVGNHYSISLLLSNIGKAYQDSQHPGEAMVHFRRALAYGDSAASHTAMGYAYNNLGALFEAQGDFNSALTNYSYSLEYYRKDKHNEGIILNLNSIGHNFINLGDSRQAQQYLNQAYRTADSLGFPLGQVNALKNQGMVDVVLNNYGLALEHYQKGLTIAQKMRQRDALRDIYAGIAEVHEAAGRTDSALYYFKSFVSLKDSLFNEQATRNINSLKIRYEIANAERENASLRAQEKQQNIIIHRNRMVIVIFALLLMATFVLLFQLSRVNRSRNRSITRLRQSEEESQRITKELAESDSLRELLLDIITHDLKNPVGVIYGFSELALEENPENDFLQRIFNSSVRLLKVLENTTILSQATFGESIPKETLNVNSLMTEIVKEHVSWLNLAEMEVEVELTDDLTINANPLIAEIFKNYLSNAIKYASEGKMIRIEGRLLPDELVIMVKDFGTTIPENDRVYVFERKAQLEKGKQKGRGLGLAIVKRIAEAHGGKVWVEPNTPTGNSFCVSLPVDNK